MVSFDPLLYSQFVYNATGQRGAFLGGNEPWINTVGMNVLNYPPTIPARGDAQRIISSTALPVGAASTVYTVPQGKVFYLVYAFMQNAALTDQYLAVGPATGTYTARIMGLCSAATNGTIIGVAFPVPLRFEYGEVLWVSNAAPANGNLTIYGWVENSPRSQ